MPMPQQSVVGCLRCCSSHTLRPVIFGPRNRSLFPMPQSKTSAAGGKGKQRSRLIKEIEADTGFGESGMFEGVGTAGI